MSKREEFIDEVVEDTASPYDAALPPAARKQMRALLHDLLQTDPVLGQLAAEQAPREDVHESEEVAVDPEVIEEAKRKRHG